METAKTKKPKVVFEGTRGYHNAVLNWLGNPKGEFMLYGDAYHEAGKKLLEALLAERSHNGIRYCPVVFLYRQSLELNLKSIIIHGNDILELHGEAEAASKKVLGHHALKPLLDSVEKIITFMGWTEGYAKGCIENFDDIKTVVDKFDEIDEGSYAFRYPTDKQGKGSVSSHFSFDIRIFVESLDPVIELMSGLSYALDEQHDLMCEAIAEARQAAMENADYGDHY